jgi:hypothetical protein
LFRWFRLSGLSRLFLSENLSCIFSFTVIIFSTVRLNSSLFLGFSLQKSWKCHLGHDPVGEGFDYFSFSDVMYLNT